MHLPSVRLSRTSVIRRLGLGVVTAVALTVAACSDDLRSGAITAPGGGGLQRHTGHDHSADLNTQIETAIDAMFSGGHRASVRARWENVKRQSMRNQSGRKQHVQLVQWLGTHESFVTPLPGETQAHAVARLSLLMSLYVHGGPSTPPPVIEPETDVVLEVVEPNEPDTVVTPAKQAAVTFPAGAVSEPTIVIVSRNLQSFEENCSGPLPTQRCQYPQFYRYDVFPDVKLNHPATVAVCHVNAGERRLPLADHERFRLAHEKPIDPSAFHPEGTIEGDIEILPLATVGSLVDCEGTDYHDHAMAAPTGMLDKLALLASRARANAGRLAGAVGEFITPTLYAIDRGGGGEVFLFSNFNVIDPQSRPDVAPSSTFTISPASAGPGDSVTVNAWSVENIGTAASVQVTAELVLASDSALTQDATTLLALPSLNAVPPQQASAVPPASVVIPEATALGTWFLGVRLTQGGVHAESDVTNNVVSARLTVADPAVLFCPDGPEGSYSTMQDAVNAAPSGGTVSVCDGTHDVSVTTVNKPLTITSVNPGQATLRDMPPTGGGGQGGPSPVFIVNGVESGTVRFADINFSVHNSSIVAGNLFSTPVGTWDRIEVHNVKQVGINPASTTSFSIRTFPSTVASARMEITESQFEDIFLSVFAISGEVNVRNSVFLRNGHAGVVYSWPGANNGPAGHGTTENNEFRGCGLGGCIRALGSGNLRIAGNTLEGGLPAEGIRLAVITIQLNAPLTDPTVLVENNTVVGARNPAFPALDANGWGDGAGILVGSATAYNFTIRGNQISNTFDALRSSGPAAFSTVATDNVINGGGFAFQHTGGSLVFTRNDAIGLAGSFKAPGGVRPGHYKCNWWGSTEGPANPPQNTAPYAPWAMQPVAGNTSPCDPDVSLATVRACSTGEIGGTPWTTRTVQQAYSNVDAGGTVLICDGTYTVSNLHLEKSVTFAAQGPGMPTLDAGGQLGVLRVFNRDIDVAVNGLRLRNGTEHLIHVNGIRSLTVRNSEFHPHQTHAYQVSTDGYQENWMSGVGAFGNIGTVRIENSAFVGGDIGVHANTGCCAPTGGVGSGTLTVAASSFTGQSNAGVFTGGGAAGYVARVENSTFENCGRFGCTKYFGNAGRAEYANNRFTVNATRPVRTPINLGLHPDGTALVSGNIIEGNGGGGDRFAQSSYPIDGSAIQFAGQTIEVSGNQIGNAWGMVNLTPGSMTGSNNVVSHGAFVVTGFSAERSNALFWQRNDVTDFMSIMPGVGDFASVNLKCNWWGSTDGPANPGAATADMYTPWANEAIANRPAVNCTP